MSTREGDRLLLPFHHSRDFGTQLSLEGGARKVKIFSLSPKAVVLRVILVSEQEISAG